MSTSIHAELAKGGDRIVLVAAGPIADVTYAAKQLQQMTPLIKLSDPKGALLCPASWPAVVQLSAIYGEQFVPGPRLQAWIMQRAAERQSALDVPLTVPVPDGLTPRPYQVAGAQLIARHGAHALITDEPGCLAGDTEIAINRAGKGFTMKLRDLVARMNGEGRRAGAQWRADIETFVQREVDGIVRLGRIKAAWRSGIKTTYTVTTETGRTIRATDEHPFLTSKGWKRLDELFEGDLVHVRGEQASGAIRIPKPRYREVAGLRAHPHARGIGRRTSTHRIAEHRLVIEADMNGLDYAVFVDKIRSGNVDGLQFLDPETHAVHHRDCDWRNNRLDNLQVLTHTEHHQLHADEGKTAHVLFKVVYERITSIEYHGEEETYDISVADDPHNFLANGFVVHNTGKTITTILGLAEWSLADATVEHLPMLIVCPASVVDPWVEALRNWAPYWTAVAWRGSPKQRREIAGTADVYVTSYDTARIDAGDTNPSHSPLIALNPRALVADECHLIKNPHAARSQAVRRLARNVKAFVALSGTPITHHPADLWPTLVCLAPGAWPSRERWVNRYCLTVPADYGEMVLGLNPGTEPEFRLSLLGQQRRVAKADVLDQLPPKVYSVRQVELPAAYRKAYDAMESDMLAQMPDGSELSVMSVLAQLTRLSQLASAAAEVTTTFETAEDGTEREHVSVTLTAPSWKVDALLEVLEERPGKPVVAFTPSAQLTRLAGQAAAKAGYRVGYVIGGQSMADRTDTVAKFQQGELDLICATTGAGGVGITLTAASTVVFLQRPWSLVESLQAEDRCHRIGSEIHECIEIVDVVAANTIDTRVRAVLREKAGQLADLVQDPRIVAELLGGASIRQLRKAS
jgi:hypothetical protein